MTLVTKARLGHWLVLVVRFPVTRIVLAGLLVIGAFNVVQVLLGELHRALGLGPLRPDALSFAVSVALAVHFAYVGYVRLVERRAAAELSLAGALPELGRGVLVGITLLAGTAAAIAALGHYHVGAVNPWTALVPPFAIALWVAYLEEIVFRGILFRIIEESPGNLVGPRDLRGGLRTRASGESECDIFRRTGHRPGSRCAVGDGVCSHPAPLAGDWNPLRVELHAVGDLRLECLRDIGGWIDRVAAERSGIDFRRRHGYGGIRVRDRTVSRGRRRLPGAGAPRGKLHTALLAPKQGNESPCRSATRVRGRHPGT